MITAIESAKLKLEITKSRLTFFKSCIKSFYPVAILVLGTILWLPTGFIRALDLLDLIFISIYSVATTFQINVLYSPERYDDSIDNLSNASLFSYMVRHMWFALPTLLILVPAVIMHAYDRIGTVAIIALAFVTATNILLIHKKSANRDFNQAQWVEF